MANIIFDLDGTLIDYSKRNYFVYKKAVKKAGGTPIQFKTYWNFKKNKVEVEKILKKSKIGKDKYTIYSKEFIKLIEVPESLTLDKLFLYTRKTLDTLKKKGHSLCLVSYRKSLRNTRKQLHKLEINDYFDVIKAGKLKKNGVLTKIAFVKEIVRKNSKNYVVGDTEDDIIAANKLGASSIAVLSGIRNKKRLLEFKPNHIAKNVSYILDIV